MQIDFHYFATYCAAYLAGYSHSESLTIGYSSQFTDLCTKTFLSALGAPLSAATTQTTFEMADASLDTASIREVTGIWASFHFLPADLYAEKAGCSKKYLEKYRLICGPNGALVADTVALAKNKSLQAVGIAMHVLADTWAHRYFAGTPSMVINNTTRHFHEIFPDGSERPVVFSRKPGGDDPETGKYTASIYYPGEASVMNLGHGRAGHLPDYSFMRYRYLPAWGEYSEIIKDNPSDYYCAFTQMIYALKTLKDPDAEFHLNQYDTEAAAPLEQEIKDILNKRQLDSSEDWKSFGQELSGMQIPDFDETAYRKEYMSSRPADRNDTFLGKYIIAALAQKKMVTDRISQSGNSLAGVSGK